MPSSQGEDMRTAVVQESDKALVQPLNDDVLQFSQRWRSSCMRSTHGEHGQRQSGFDCSRLSCRAWPLSIRSAGKPDMVFLLGRMYDLA